MKRRESELIAPDGTRLHYSVEGEGPRDFVLCDGIGCDGFVWRYLRPWLCERGRVVHLHMRGHGRSDAPEDEEQLSIEACADDVGALMAQESVRDGLLLGHSMGVQVALETWHRHPEPVGGLALLCGSFENPVATFHDSGVLESVLPLLQGATRLGGRLVERAWSKLIKLPIAFHVARITEVHPDLIRREDFEPYLEHLSKMEPRLFFRLLGAAGAHSAGAFLADIDVPVLIVAGDQDGFTPAHRSETMAAGIPGCDLVMIEEGTHTAPIEHPTLIEMELERFLHERLAH